MKRRGFLKLLSFAPAVAAVPALAATQPANVLTVAKLKRAVAKMKEQPITALEIVVRNGTHVDYRLDMDAWQVCTIAPVGAVVYEWATIHPGRDRPTADDMEFYHSCAMQAFRRAQRKFG